MIMEMGRQNHRGQADQTRASSSCAWSRSSTAAGNLVGISRPGDNTTYVYDYRNQLTRVESPGLTVSFTYDALGRRVNKTIQRPNSPTRQVNYVYDGLRVIEERDGGGVLVSRYAYGNGLDEPLEIERRIDNTLQSHLPMQDSVGNVIGLADSAGNLVERVNYSPFGAARFKYDHEPPRVDQLRVADGLVRVRFSEPVEQGSLQKAWRLSSGQGQLSGTFSYLEKDRLAVFTPSQPLPQDQALEVRISTELSDKSGNRLEQEFSRSFTYQGVDLLVYDRGPPEVESVRLEGRSLRVQFTEEIAGGNLDGALRLSRNGNPVSGALSLEDDKTLLFSAAANPVNGAHYSLELTGSIRDLSGKALAPVTESFTCQGGKQLVYERPAADEHRESYVGNTTLFQGREYDYETGLYYFRARYYHPEIGRFLQTDPKGYIDSMNLYQAFNMNPVNYVDPMGERIEVIGKSQQEKDAVLELLKATVDPKFKDSIRFKPNSDFIDESPFKQILNESGNINRLKAIVESSKHIQLESTDLVDSVLPVKGRNSDFTFPLEFNKRIRATGFYLESGKETKDREVPRSKLPDISRALFIKSAPDGIRAISLAEELLLHGYQEIMGEMHLTHSSAHKDLPEVENEVKKNLDKITSEADKARALEELKKNGIGNFYYYIKIVK